ncbi:MAG: aminotransferase class I/II-fold pyridoxal phosphate-dependent enzyme [Lachnospiraceae bacterium]
MIYFNCDYLEGAHESIMELMMRTNMEQTIGYGEDDYCEQARVLIKEACKAPDADVHFLVGGTQTNATVISAALRKHQGVLSAVSGHINVHETGAIEHAGHKVLALPSEDGKITATQIEQALDEHYADDSFEHIVQPGMVYISHPTEWGTSYTKAELEAISETCRKYEIPLFLDGARLAYGLMACDSDLDLPTIAKLCDVFYIGGTKCGALMGEAVVISHPLLKKDFRYHIKQMGGMFAKGRMLGLQFLGLFTDDLYYKVGGHGILLADRLRKAIVEKGLTLYMPNTTNQVFVIVSQEQLQRIQEQFSVSRFANLSEDEIVIRICTSWATKETAIDALIETINTL